MINKIIHQIWIGKYNIPEREQSLYKGIIDNHPNYEHHLWTDNNLPEIPERLQAMYNIMYEKKDYVYCADMVRWLVVYQYGGWYLDIDFEYITGLDTLNIDHRDGILFGHWGEGWQHCDYTFANNVFGFEKNHPLIKHMIDNMQEDIIYCNCPYSPGWTGINVKKYLGLENEFCNEIWEYHRVVREYLDKHNIEYGDYNRFQNENLKHYSLFAWSHENKVLFEKGLIK